MKKKDRTATALTHNLISHCEQQEEKEDNLVFMVLFISQFFG
jgi:hypothetical protein